MKNFIVFALLFFIFHAYSQKNNPVLFTMGNEPVYLDEFRYIYEKNNKSDSSYYKPENVREYLNLFINFKLKVREAKRTGVDTSQAFNKEFNSYRDQLVRPYLTDKTTIDRLVREAYERMKWEINASHIMIKVSEDALPADTLKAYNKILEVYNKLKAGDDFEKLAIQYSEDPSVKYNKGTLGYFTAFNLIYSFETKAYNTPVGQYSAIFRSQFGYHILKVNQRRLYRGQIKVAEILVRKIAITTNDTVDHAKLRIDSAYNKLLAGAGFEDMVKLYSDDERTKGNKGMMQPISSTAFQLPESFKDVAFSLKKDGEFSKPFKTPQGWVIIQRKELKGLDSFTVSENLIRENVNKDSRAQFAEENMIKNLSAEYKLKENKKALDAVVAQIDTTFFTGKWTIKNPGKLSKELFRIGNVKYSQLDFAKFIESNQRSFASKNINFAIQKMYNEFLKQSVYSYANNHLENKYPEFKNLVNEYREGMMLFEITDRMVWAKAMNDTVGQENFYNQSKSKYQWKKRVEADIYTCKTPETANKVVKLIEQDKLTADSITKLLNKDDANNVKINNGAFEENENPTINGYFGQTGIIQTGNQQNQVINMKKYLAPEPKKLSEVRGIIISEYQNYLEKKWIEELKAKYPIEINEETVKMMVKK